MRRAAPRRATTWPRPRAGTAYPRPPRITNPFYTAGWVRSCLQDESGRTNRACDWPARTCNASGSRADCAVSRRLPGQSRASLPAREEPLRMRRTRFSATRSVSLSPAFPLSPPLPRRSSRLSSFVRLYAIASPDQRLSQPAVTNLSSLSLPIPPSFSCTLESASFRPLIALPGNLHVVVPSRSLSTDDDRRVVNLLIFFLRSYIVGPFKVFKPCCVAWDRHE